MQEVMSAYTIRRSSRAKRITLHVHPEGRVVVTVPTKGSLRAAERFVLDNKGWIATQLRSFSRVGPTVLLPGGRRDYLRFKERARMAIHAHIRRINTVYGFSFNRVSVKDLSSRWGSCSELGNLNFNFRIIHLPEHLAVYVITHELCHLGELNHSKRFWQLVSRAVPNHEECRRELERYLL